MSKSNNDFFKEKKSWSEVKDELLGGYLIPYFSKILKTRKPIFYIDGFAGKGKFEDGGKGSPLIALECLEKSLSQFKGEKEPNISMNFIELNHAEELKSNLLENQKRISKIVSGKFEENILQLLQDAAKKNKNQNVFLYIDPYGVKALNHNLFGELPKIFYTAELLINLNSWGFLRMVLAINNTKFIEEKEVLTDLVEYESSMNGTIKEINDIAGGNYWQRIVEKYKDGKISGYQAEEEFSQQYKLHLRKKYKYVLDMPIKLKSENYPKYRMVYATNHPGGCVLMADNMSKRTERLITDIQNKGLRSFFDENINNEIISEEEIEKKAQKILEKFLQYEHLDTFLAEFFNEYGVYCNTTKIKEALKLFENSRYIDVRRTPNLTNTGKVSTFWSAKSGQTLELRKK